MLTDSELAEIQERLDTLGSEPDPRVSLATWYGTDVERLLADVRTWRTVAERHAGTLAGAANILSNDEGDTLGQIIREHLDAVDALLRLA